MTSMDTEAALDRAERLRAGLVSLAVSVLLLAVKFLGYRWTRSAAVLSDALESIVNVAAALFAVTSLAIATRPADSNHPYGHGKVEFLSSAFEGGLIAFAALLIVYQAGETLLSGSELRALDAGLALMAVAAVGNALLGAYLLRVGRRARSPALEADAQHVLGDVWTTVGVCAGLALVWATGIESIDPLVAALVGLHLAVVGFGLVRQSIGALLDETDPALLRKLADAIAAIEVPGVIAVHRLRAIRVGGAVHVDAHVVVPRFWQVSAGHEVALRFEEEVARRLEREAELEIHIDPCTSAYCAGCSVEPCPVRAHPFVRAPAPTVAELTADPPPS